MISQSEMEAVKRYLLPKRQLTPKINHTKTTIAKSTPFLISKHHLDDTEMKRALHYQDETIKDDRNRRYSYKGEVISCQNSKISTKINPQPQTTTNRQKLKSATHKMNDYNSKNYALEQQQKPSTQEENLIRNQIPYFTNSGVREVRSNTNIVNRQHQVNLKEQNSYKKSHLLNRECQEYGLEQMYAARKKIQKQARKLKKLHKKKVDKDIEQIQNYKISKLQNQIKNLKIQTLQSSQKYKNQLYQRLRQEQQIKQKINSNQTLKINRAKLILSKPIYITKQTKEDTDSSFSSFQLQ